MSDDATQEDAVAAAKRFNDARPGGIIHMSPPEPRTPMSTVEAVVVLGCVAIAAALIGFVVWVIAG